MIICSGFDFFSSIFAVPCQSGTPLAQGQLRKLARYLSGFPFRGQKRSVFNIAFNPHQRKWNIANFFPSGDRYGNSATTSQRSALMTIYGAMNGSHPLPWTDAKCAGPKWSSCFQQIWRHAERLTFRIRTCGCSVRDSHRPGDAPSNALWTRSSTCWWWALPRGPCISLDVGSQCYGLASISKLPPLVDNRMGRRRGIIASISWSWPMPDRLVFLNPSHWPVNEITTMPTRIAKSFNLSLPQIHGILPYCSILFIQTRS